VHRVGSADDLVVCLSECGRELMLVFIDDKIVGATKVAA
jgi:hypothetical protein